VSSKTLFLIDGIGAILTATLLAGVLAPFESVFGIPPRALYILAGIAAIFAVYSLTLYIRDVNNSSRFLKGIAIANLFYCVLTLGVLNFYAHQVTMLGIGYFIVEILVVSTLSIFELNSRETDV